jgi:hypothetical protein
MQTDVTDSRQTTWLSILLMLLICAIWSSCQ